MRIANTLLLNVFILSLLSLASCTTEDVTEDLQRTFTTEDHIQLGRIIVEEVKNDAFFNIVPESNSPELYEYLNSALQTISGSFVMEEGQFYDWEIFLVDDATVNAFTLPGGKVFITKGMLSFLGAENQLMSVIGHEMAYAEKGFALEYLNGVFGAEETSKVISGFHAKASDMFLSIQQASYTAAQIKKADEFSSMVLCPYTYSNGLVSVITNNTGAANASTMDLVWLERKMNYDGRVELIESFAPRFCCHGEETYEVRFDQMIAQYLEAASSASNS